MTRTQTPPDPALLLDVMAQLFAAGSALTAALAVCGKNFPGCQALSDVATKLSVGLDWDTAWQDTTDVNHLNVLAQELRFVYFSAVPAAHMLTTAATTLRANRKRQAEQLAQELAIRLVLPTGICLLPSFIFLGIIPMVLALLPG